MTPSLTHASIFFYQVKQSKLILVLSFIGDNLSTKLKTTYLTYVVVQYSVNMLCVFIFWP